MKNHRIVFYLICAAALSSCKRQKALFMLEPSSHTQIQFNNKIVENDSINPLDKTNVYNGGGVGIGDFNNDGLPDIYFTGNLVANKLYLNKGNLVFEDITDAAGVAGNAEWCRGVSVVDINNDGWQDIYVSASMFDDPQKRKNLLYINQKTPEKGKVTFKEQAAEYGLDDTTHSTMAQFFDYDNDGDLDMYLVVNEIVKNVNPSIFNPIIKDGSFPSTGRLYENIGSDSLKHPFFRNVSKKAGITIEGYGHDATIADVNLDGWKDIFVSNDFVSNDILYINNQDGTFTDRQTEYFKHSSANGMGQDIQDINNDGLADVVELDMNPRDNLRKKMMMNANSYQTYQNSDYFGYQYQYVRNTLQINQGPTVGANDSIGHPIFSDVSYFAGIAETDWSWTPLVADFDNDGNKDIIVTNGFPKDVTDHDFVSFRQQSYSIATKDYTLSQIPEVKIHNYAFRNLGDLRFADATMEWGLSIPRFSNGGVYADLDNDGDLDLVINNINDEALVYRNTSNDQKNKNAHYLRLRFAGPPENVNGLGAIAAIHYDHGKQQVWENTPFRGYLSTVQDMAHFGLAGIDMIDSVIIKWPGGKMQLFQGVKADQTIIANISQAIPASPGPKSLIAAKAFFTDVTDSFQLRFTHAQADFVDFNIQKLLPHKFSEYGPGLAAGDIDGNGLDDLICGGAAGHDAKIFQQQSNHSFKQDSLQNPGLKLSDKGDDTGILLFDADRDGDPDLYVARGGYSFQSQTAPYQDQLFINDGKGHFTRDSLALPKNFTSKFCVRAADYDKDGDLDLFVAGRVDPWNYPKPVNSFVFRNDSKNGRPLFTDVTSTVAKDLANAGLVCDALFTDFDNDGWLDLVLAGEWMPVTFLKNDKGIFKNVSSTSGVNDQLGWWNTIAPGDFDNDGDIDYVVGNLGENSFYKASDKHPVSIYAKDFDNNGSYDAFPSIYLPASQLDTTVKEFPVQTRDDIVKQMIGMRSKFQNYKSFANATMDQLFTKEQLKDALIRKVNNLKSGYLINDGHGKFSFRPLPVQAQVSVLNGMTIDDYDGDGNLDVLINGNDFGTEVSVGRYDALNGLLLLGDGKGAFRPQTILQSGIFIPGNGKAMVKLRDQHGNYLIAAAQNRGPLKLFKLKTMVRTVPVQPDDEYAVIKFRDGHSQKQEFYYGSSFLSESARILSLGANVISATVYNSKGEGRSLAY